MTQLGHQGELLLSRMFYWEGELGRGTDPFASSLWPE